MYVILIYLFVAIISGATLGVPTKNLIMKNNWITDTLELTDKSISNEVCIIISIVISVIIAICLYYFIKGFIENISLTNKVLCSLLIPLLTFIALYIIALLCALLYWGAIIALGIIILAVVAWVFLFDY